MSQLKTVVATINSDITNVADILDSAIYIGHWSVQEQPLNRAIVCGPFADIAAANDYIEQYMGRRYAENADAFICDGARAREHLDCNPVKRPIFSLFRPR